MLLKAVFCNPANHAVAADRNAYNRHTSPDMCLLREAKRKTAQRWMDLTS